MKKKLSLGLSILVGLFAVGCGNNTQSNQVVIENAGKETIKEKEYIKVGLISSIDALPLLIAKEEGYFDAQQIEVDIEYFKSAKDRDAALQAGELDGVLCDQIAISIYQNAGLNMQITGRTDGSLTILAGKDSGIEQINDLVGKKIAISENTMIEYTLDQVLEQANITIDSVEKVAIPSMVTRLEMLNSGEIDAAVMPSPFSDTALASGHSSLQVIDSKTDLYSSVTTFKQEVIDEKSDVLKAYYKAYNQAVDYINMTDINQYETIIIDTIGYPESMRGNIVVPVYSKNVLPTVESVEATFKWASEKGLLTKEIEAQDVLNTVAFNA